MHGKAVFVARPLLVLVIVLAYPGAISATEPVAVKIRDLTSIEGVRENPLIGYGMVVGLTRTGDSQQTAFTTQTLANIMQRMGATIPAATARVNNVASVFVTASLPAFARPGTQVDVTVSSIGDAKSLEGGLLLLTQLYGADGQVYAAAQGPVAVGGFVAGGAGARKRMNHPTVGRVPARGRVVVNERTGTIVMGKDVRLGAVSILHGGFSVQISTEYSVSQPAPLSSGTTEVVGKTEVQAKDSPARRLEIGEGASIDDLVSGLQNMGATARDVISILQAIKAAGALDADLEVI